MKYRKWSLDQKLEILSRGEEIGVVEWCRKYGVHPSCEPTYLNVSRADTFLP